MKEIFENNMEVLKRKYFKIYKTVEEIQERKMDIEVLTSKDSNKYMQISLNERKININSRYRPIEEAEKWANNIELEDHSQIILFGIGLGYRVQKIMKKIGKTNRLIVIEPNVEIFLTAIENVDLSDAISKENVLLLIGEDEFYIKKKLGQYISMRYIDQLCFEYIPNYNIIFNEDFQKYEKILKEEIRDLAIIKNTEEKFKKIWFENYVQNLKYVVKSINVKEFSNKFENIPVVIVSAGPSLNKNVKLLKEIKNRALIVCVGTAVKVLLREGIIPDIIATLDGDIKNYYHFKDIDYYNIPILYNPSVCPRILQEHKGMKIVTGGSHPYLGEELNKSLKEIEILEVGGSVAHLAFSFAKIVGADPIIFIGQDLSYGNNNQTHAEGTSYSEGKLNINKLKENEQLLIKGIYGDEVLTDIAFNKFLRWFEKEINCDKSKRLYINATEGGAHIEGTLVKRLKEVLDEHLKKRVDVSKMIKEIYSKRKVLSKQDFDAVLRDLEEISNKFKRLSCDFENAVKKLGTMGRNGKWISKVNQSIQEIEKVKRKYSKDMEINKMLTNVLSKDYPKANRIHFEEREKDQHRVYIEKELEFLQYIKTEANYIADIIHRCTQELK
ncbi:6-hydroxymethylpterin diphosphokinase MptE-like protein [Wukongibacter baidiensis]|uniref:motility associated factor glycosyltransferase family protein n=1 Tax=Wukongibacter baidiensis TaxID=1723361 RepID=UPI003D7FFE65